MSIYLFMIIMIMEKHQVLFLEEWVVVDSYPNWLIGVFISNMIKF